MLGVAAEHVTIPLTSSNEKDFLFRRTRLDDPVRQNMHAVQHVERHHECQPQQPLPSYAGRQDSASAIFIFFRGQEVIIATRVS